MAGPPRGGGRTRPVVRSGGAAVWIVVCLVVAGGVLRLADLGNRPLHGDEAVGASLARRVGETGSFVYEHANRHGPFQYLAGAAAMAIGGETDRWIRLPHAVLGSLIPLSVILFRRRLTDTGWIVATGALAFSPSFVYYSRYAIQEIDFALATALLFGCGAAFAEGRRRGALAGCCLVAGWMVTIKETFVIVWGCAALALAVGAAVGGRLFRTALVSLLRDAVRLRGTLLVGALTGLFMVVAAYTDLFRHGAGLANLARNLGAMLSGGATGAGAAALHAHPAWYGVSLLLRYEPVIVALAAAGIAFAIRSGGPFVLLLALYALATGAVHLALPYKTPWLLLTPLLPLAILAGRGGAALLEGPRTARFPGLPLAAAVAVTLVPLPRAILLGFVRPADPVAEPIVYHQAGEEGEAMARAMRRILATLPEAPGPRAVVCLPYQWPLAWRLRDERGILWERGPIPSGSREDLASVPLVVTLEAADPAFLESFAGSAVVPPFSPPDHVGRSYVLVPPRYLVARLWIRRDLADRLPATIR